MFKIKELQKLKLELLNSLIKETNQYLKEIPKQYKKKAETVLKEYIKTKSIAGLELWVSGVSEYLYFAEALEDLEELKTEPTKLKEFQTILSESLKSDFGVEDFRFIEWERANPKYPVLQSILSKYTEDSLKSCYTIQENVFLGKKSDFTYYEKANGDPSTKGVKVKTIRKKTPKEKILQIEKAHEYLEAFWQEGFELYSLLTDKVHIIESNGLVSYSHFQEQGISYINFIDRDILESVDDLIHENSHHHLNLILKKYKILKKDLKEDVFYSPWRKSLRPLYAILHATFTFSYGALLFYHIVKSENWVYTDLPQSYKERANVRFAEETLMVEYSLIDLKWAMDKGYFTKKGISLIESLSKYNKECLSYLPETIKKIKSKEMKQNLVALQKTLSESREQYRLA
ncbi:MAG: hypothetical protein KBA66_14745 [Leptospiraceae bacterium]|nr:hypothetical protein [Leptospiraceae bacterium]